MSKILAFSTPTGTPVLFVSQSHQKTAHGVLLVHCGSIDDPEHRPGLSHLAEHVISSRTLGGAWGEFSLASAGTRRDSIRLTIEAGDLPRLLQGVLTVVPKDIRIGNAEVREHLGIMAREADFRAHARPHARAFQAAAQTLYGPVSAYSRDPSGDLEALESTTPSEIAEHISVGLASAPYSLAIFGSDSIDAASAALLAALPGLRAWERREQPQAEVGPVAALVSGGNSPTRNGHGRWARLFWRVPPFGAPDPRRDGATAVLRAVVADPQDLLLRRLRTNDLRAQEPRAEVTPMWRGDSLAMLAVQAESGHAYPDSEALVRSLAGLLPELSPEIVALERTRRARSLSSRSTSALELLSLFDGESDTRRLLEMEALTFASLESVGLSGGVAIHEV